jgi:hypothetical protein
MYNSGIVRAMWIELEADVVGDDDRHHVGGRGFAELCQKLSSLRVRRAVGGSSW